MLKKRIATAAVIGIVLVATVLWFPPAVALGVFALVVLMGSWEWGLFAGFAKAPSRLLYVLAMAYALYMAWGYTRVPQNQQAFLLAALIWWGMAFAWVALAPEAHNRMTAALGGFAVLVAGGVALARLHELPERGPQLLLFLLLLVWAADIGAFFAGRRFGRIKLAPRVSPNKTWEGLLGGVLVSGIVAVAGLWWFSAPPAFLSLCLGVVLISIVGDLTESMFKRFAGLKDSGSLFPGHGGVLDRFDSIMAAAPLFLLGLHWLGWVG